MGKRLAGQPEHAEDIDIKCALKIGIGLLGDRLGDKDSGGRDNNVNRPQIGQGHIHLARISHIDDPPLDIQATGAQRFRPFQNRLAAIHGDHMITLRRQQLDSG